MNTNLLITFLFIIATTWNYTTVSRETYSIRELRKHGVFFLFADIILPNLSKTSIFGHFFFYFGHNFAFLTELPIKNLKLAEKAWVCQIWKKSSHTMIIYVNLTKKYCFSNTFMGWFSKWSDFLHFLSCSYSKTNKDKHFK